jgi:histidinol-phosphate aminotransferase
MSRPQPRRAESLQEGYHSPQVAVDVRLNTNEAPEPPPVEFVERFATAVRDIAWHRYPDRSATALRRRLAAVEGVAPEWVFAANGSNEVLQTILLAWGSATRPVLTFEPTYALHTHIAKVVGCPVVHGERDADFRLDPAAVAATVHEVQPSVVFLCSPNNPTGGLEPDAVVFAALAAAEDVGALLVVDEAYGQFAPRSFVRDVGEDRSLAVSRTYSKTWSMAAARLGHVVAPLWVVEQMDATVLPYHLDAAKQLAGLIALDFEDEMNDRVQRLVGERERLVAGLARLDVEWWPSAANFVLFRPRGRSGDAIWQRLVDRSVLIRNCSSWPRLENCLRVTIGTPEENDRFLAALTEALEETP